MAISVTGMIAAGHFPMGTQGTSLLWGFVLQFWSFYLLIECFVIILRWLLRCCWKI